MGLGASNRLRQWLYQRYPLVVVQFSAENIHTEPSDAVGLVNDLHPIDSPPERPRMVVPLSASVGGGEFAPPRTPSPVEWDVTTALQWHRIEDAFAHYTPEIKKSLAGLFCRGPFTWRLVGVERDADILNADSRFRLLAEAGRFRLESYDNDLESALSRTRVLFFPPGLVGGGGAMRMALEQGVPVLAQRNSNAANFIDRQFLYDDQSDMAALLGRLLNDEPHRLQVARAQQDQLRRDCTTEAEGRAMTRLLALARVEAQKRFGPTSDVPEQK